MISAGKKANNRKSGAAAANKKSKQDEAKLRQEAYSHMTIPERITLAQSRRGESKREITRLELALKDQKKHDHAPGGAKQKN